MDDKGGGGGGLRGPEVGWGWGTFLIEGPLGRYNRFSNPWRRHFVKSPRPHIIERLISLC